MVEVQGEAAILIREYSYIISYYQEFKNIFNFIISTNRTFKQTATVKLHD